MRFRVDGSKARAVGRSRQGFSISASRRLTRTPAEHEVAAPRGAPMNLLSYTCPRISWIASIAFVVVTFAAPGSVRGQGVTVPTRVFLNGAPAPVYFNDGDTFRVLGGRFSGMRARLAGFNTLESYGNVPRVGLLDPKRDVPPRQARHPQRPPRGLAVPQQGFQEGRLRARPVVVQGPGRGPSTERSRPRHDRDLGARRPRPPRCSGRRDSRPTWDVGPRSSRVRSHLAPLHGGGR